MFGLESLRIPQVGVPEPGGVGVRRERRGRRFGWVDGEFLRGPVPLAWLGRLCALKGGKVVAVGLAVWFVAGLRGRKAGLKLTTAGLARFGVHDRAAKSRALAALERAGLVRVTRRPGKNPVVDILEVGGGAAPGGLPGSSGETPSPA